LEWSRKNLIVILEKAGKCGFLTVCAINLLFFVKKFGISLSIAKAYLVLVIASFLIIGGVAAASVYTVKKVIDIRQSAAVKIEDTKTDAVNLPPPVAAVNNGNAVSPMRKLYNKYNHIEKVHLKDGSILEGVVNGSGPEIDIITPEGTLKVSRDDILSVEYPAPDSL